MLKGNKGEWSEPYALLKLLSDRKLALGDENFRAIEDLFYPISAIIRHEKDRNVNFSYEGNIILIKDEANAYSIPISEFEYYAELCKRRIQEKKKEKGAFSIPEIEMFLQSFSIHSLKAKSKNKHDITVQIDDPKTLFAPILGFSIKSQFGAPSTLVNASGATNFSYSLSSNLSDEDIKAFEGFKLFADKFEFLKIRGISLEFEKAESITFQTNLQTIDFNFEKVLGDALLAYFGDRDSKNKTVKSLIQNITSINKYGYNTHINPEIYEMMMKKFLVEYALGMRANEVWKRDYQASGGYLVIRTDGEILCYHFYFLKKFEEYLFDNTKLETADIKKHGFGSIYLKENKQYVKLNLQIRFIK